MKKRFVNHSLFTYIVHQFSLVPYSLESDFKRLRCKCVISGLLGLSQNRCSGIFYHFQKVTIIDFPFHYPISFLNISMLFREVIPGSTGIGTGEEKRRERSPLRLYFSAMGNRGSVLLGNSRRQCWICFRIVLPEG